jgi:hypothetical protein
MKKRHHPRKHRIRYLSHTLTAALLCIAAWIWAGKSMGMASALLIGAGVYGFAALRELQLSEEALPRRSALPSPKPWGRDIFKSE